jgi:hypothetical protein
METKKYSRTYVQILDLIFKTKTINIPISQVNFDNGRFARISTGKETTSLSQDFYVAAAELWAMCTPHEWYMIGRISSELKSYNALWHCDPEIKKSSANIKVIRGLKDKQILIPTETTDIYLVNPVYIRRGDFSSVLHTTASLLMNEATVQLEHIKNCRPIKELDVRNDAFINNKL